MDDDLDVMMRDELIAYVKQLRQGIRTHRDSTGPPPAGIIRRSGVCSPRRPIRSRRSRHGRTSCVVVSDTVSRSMSNCLTHYGHTRHITVTEFGGLRERNVR